MNAGTTALLPQVAQLPGIGLQRLWLMRICQHAL